MTPTITTNFSAGDAPATHCLTVTGSDGKLRRRGSRRSKHETTSWLLTRDRQRAALRVRDSRVSPITPASHILPPGRRIAYRSVTCAIPWTKGGGARLVRGATANGPCPGSADGREICVAKVSEDEVLLLWRALVAYRSGPASVPDEWRSWRKHLNRPRTGEPRGPVADLPACSPPS